MIDARIPHLNHLTYIPIFNDVLDIHLMYSPNGYYNILLECKNRKTLTSDSLRKEAAIKIYNEIIAAWLKFKHSTKTKKAPKKKITKKEKMANDLIPLSSTNLLCASKDTNFGSKVQSLNEVTSVHLKHASSGYYYILLECNNGQTLKSISLPENEAGHIYDELLFAWIKFKNSIFKKKALKKKRTKPSNKKSIKNKTGTEE